MKAEFLNVGIRVKNLRRSLNFYTKVLGMKVRSRGKIPETGGEFIWLEHRRGGPILELNHYGKSSPYNTRYTGGEELDHLAFKVEDLDECLKEAESQGCPTILEVRTGEGRWAYIKDPNGIWIEFM